ncbi:MAG: hypothetical protein HWE20_02450 [Gammaproteobacteria bacterium]|nr:hypothetical protein [Gammaproteobacteria bacterium]
MKQELIELDLVWGAYLAVDNAYANLPECENAFEEMREIVAMRIEHLLNKFEEANGGLELSKREYDLIHTIVVCNWDATSSERAKAILRETV